MKAGFEEKMNEKRYFIEANKMLRTNVQHPSTLASNSFVLKNNSDGEIDSIVFIVLSGRGCFWIQSGGGCSMCGFPNYTNPHLKIRKGEIFRSFRKEFEKQTKTNLGNILLLVYTSGSFFDENEMPIYDREMIFDYINNREEIVQVDVETAINFVNEKTLKAMSSRLKKKICVAVGLESSNSYVRNIFINKPPFSNKEFESKCTLIKKYAKLKVNLILKPICLTEAEAIDNVASSVNYCVKNKVDYVYIGGCNIQTNTLAHFLWAQQLYEPPMLISLLALSKRLKRKKVKIIYGGFMDYPKPLVEMFGCRQCKKKITDYFLGKTRELSMSDINCGCKQIWFKKMKCRDSSSLKSRAIKLIEMLKIYGIISKK